MQTVCNFCTNKIFVLKVVGNEKEGKVANDRNCSRTSAIEVCLSLNFAVIFYFVYLPFPPSKAYSN